MVTFTGLRHIHLKVTNVQRAALFYQEGLGMERVVTKYGGRMVILSTPGGGDALTVSEGPIGADDLTVSEASIGAEVVRSGRAGDNGGIDHFGFTLADQSQVERAVGRLVAAGATLVRVTEVSPGWPTAFLQDPDGYAFQI